MDRSPLLLFDEVPGYEKGFRCLYGMLGSPLRLALGMGIDPETSGDRRAMLDAYRSRIKQYQPVPPRMVSEGPVLQNIDRDDDVDLMKFPVPVHHEKDGGRYIGTACGVITKDPDTGRVNVGTYRVMLNGRNIATSYISNGKQGRIQRDKYLSAGKKCPMVIVVGIDPATYIAARYTLADNIPELDWAGGLSGQPMECIEGEVTGLPFPARSELVLEGWVSPDETALEGPFGEWTGYYAGDAKEEPVIHIERVYYRDNPILTCAPARNRRTVTCSRGASFVRPVCWTHWKGPVFLM